MTQLEMLLQQLTGGNTPALPPIPQGPPLGPIPLGPITPPGIAAPNLGTLPPEKGGRGKEGGITQYAKRIGKSQGYISQVRAAGEVAAIIKPISQLMGFEDKAQHLTAIHGLPL